MIGRILVLTPLLWRAMAAETNTNTRSGAMAFNAETNKTPKIGITVVSFGKMAASMMPTIRLFLRVFMDSLTVLPSLLHPGRLKRELPIRLMLRGCSTR